MEIVIKIPKEYYEALKEMSDESLSIIDRAIIRNGKPLPEHHGDLIDRRELKKEVYTTTEWNGDVHKIIYEASVDDAPTIIKESESE